MRPSVCLQAVEQAQSEARRQAAKVTKLQQLLQQQGGSKEGH